MDKKFNILFLFLGLLLFSFSVSALTVQSPLSTSTIRGNVQFYATFGANDINQFGNTSNFSVGIAPAGTNNWVRINVNVTSNNTRLLSVYNNTNNIADGTYDVNITAFNITGNQLISNIGVNVIIDNTNPVAKFRSDVSTLKLYKGLQADCSQSTDSTDSDLDFNITLINPDGVVVRTVQSGTGVVDFIRDTDFESIGSYSLKCEAVDNISNYGNVTLTIDVRSGSNGVVVLSVPDNIVTSTQQLVSSDNSVNVGGVNLLLVSVVVIVLLGIIVILNSGGKKRR